MWRRNRHLHPRWVPWFLMSRTRRRIFSWLAVSLGVGIALGHYVSHPKWWAVVIGFGRAVDGVGRDRLAPDPAGR